MGKNKPRVALAIRWETNAEEMKKRKKKRCTAIDESFLRCSSVLNGPVERNYRNEFHEGVRNEEVLFC